MKQLIEYEEVLRNVVKKYNKGVWDEDMMQDAWLKATECYNTCLNKNITDDNVVQAKIITWVKNYFINENKKKRIETVPFTDELDTLQYIDTALALVELRDCLNEKENEILTFLLQGCTVPEICELMKLKKTQVYRIMAKIRGKIKD